MNKAIFHKAILSLQELHLHCLYEHLEASKFCSRGLSKWGGGINL